MKNFSNIRTIFFKELVSYFNSAIAYVIMVVFLAILSWFFVNNIFLYDVASMRGMFSLIPLVFLFIIPAITMRLLSEERKSGTIELLTTKPISDYEIIIGKFLAAWAMIAITLLPTVIYWITIASLGEMDNGPVIGAYLGTLFVAAVYLSVGIFASSLTESQVVSFIIGIAFVFVLFILDKTLIFLPDWAASTVEFIGVDYHFSNIARGVIDSRDIFYFFTVTGFMFYLTAFSLERRKW